MHSHNDRFYDRPFIHAKKLISPQQGDTDLNIKQAVEIDKSLTIKTCNAKFGQKTIFSTCEVHLGEEDFYFANILKLKY